MTTTALKAELSSEPNDSLDLERGVEVNELVQVRVSSDTSAVGYYSRVNDILEGKYVIAWPTHDGRRMPVHRDQVVDLYFVRRDIPHAFSCLVDDTRVSPLPQITVIPCGPVSRVERRQSFRLKCLVPVEIIGEIPKGTEDSGGDPNRISSFSTTTYDLSGGGISFRNEASIPENCLLEAKLSLPDFGSVIKVPCRVVYSNPVRVRKLLYHTGLCFLAISEADRARIFRYMFRIQLKNLPTSLL